MKVLIVAKTRREGGACIGGITFDGRSVRLITANEVTDVHEGLEYNIGEVWEIDITEPTCDSPPHLENVLANQCRRMGPMTSP